MSEPADHALGRSRGGFGTKLHLLTCGRGVVLAATLTPGQASESQQLDALLGKVRVGRRRRGEAVVCDKGYDVPRCREAVRRRGMRCVIPRRGLAAGKRRRKRGRPPAFDRELYRRRNVVERRVRGLKRYRRLSERREKLATNFIAFVQLAVARDLLELLFSNGS